MLDYTLSIERSVIVTELSTRILIVDDEPSIRGSLSAYLEDFGYNIQTAESAEVALEIIDKNTFDIAVVDLRLPIMSGDALILEIHKKYPDILFLIHTGSVDYKLSEDLINIGILPEHILLKPLRSLNNLIESIKGIIVEKADSNG